MMLRIETVALMSLNRAATVRERRRSSKMVIARPATLPDGRGSVSRQSRFHLVPFLYTIVITVFIFFALTIIRILGRL